MLSSPAKAETVFAAPRSCEEGDPDITHGDAARMGLVPASQIATVRGRTGSGY